METTPRTLNSEYFSLGVLLFKVLIPRRYPFTITNGGSANVSERLIPIISLICLVGGIIIISNINSLEYVIISIIKNAFNFTSVSGEVLGYSVKQTMRFGLARSLHSNEAIEGNAPVLLYGVIITAHPTKQELFEIIKVFIDAIIICSFTAFIVLSSGVHTSDISPALYVMKAFSYIQFTFKYIIAISMTLFAFSSILAQNVTLTYLFNSKIASYFKYVFVLLVILGSISSLKSVWLIHDILLGIIIIPNLIVILLLHKDVDYYTKDYFKKLKKDKKEIIKEYVSDR